MKSFTALTLLTALVSTVSSQATNGCDENYSGTFEIAPYNVTESIPQQAQTICTTNPIVTLKNGVLTDQEDRTGEVVANHQFQFDKPVQGPTTSGFSVCSNGSLALNGNAVFYGCTSGGFSNLYDISIGAQCHEIYIVTFPCVGTGTGPVAGGSSSSSSSSSSSTSTSTSSTPVAPPATSTTPAPPPVTSSTTPVSVPPPATSTTVTPAPFPAGNATAPASTASKATVSSSATTTTSSSTTTTTPTPAATFKGAANIVVVGGKVVAVVAGIAAFALV